MFHRALSKPFSLLSAFVDDVAPSIPVTAILMSDRMEGVITTLGSMIRSTSTPIQIILIGNQATNEKVQTHFAGRTSSFIIMTIEEAQNDLINQGLSPIWTWDEWHSSRDPNWKNENTIHVAEWDDLHTHDHELNHLRFYIPFLSVLKETEHVFFIDDDLLIKKDLNYVLQEVKANLNPSAGLTCPCNIWTWNDQCHHFEFKSKYANIVQTSPLYGGRSVCESESEEYCLPKNFDAFVKEALPTIDTDPEDQTGECV